MKNLFLSPADALELDAAVKTSAEAAQPFNVALPSGRTFAVYPDGRLEEAYPTSENQLIAGRWYALAFRSLETNELDWSGAQLLKYLGRGDWIDEAGAPVERIWDPIVQTWIAPGAVDAFMVQA